STRTSAPRRSRSTRRRGRRSSKRSATGPSRGCGEAMTKARSLKALETAAKRGDASALHELYLAYAQGARGAKRDVEKAMAFLRRAAEAGHAVSQRCLASEIYGEDRAGSLRWALAASEQGDAEAMVHAAEMLIAGKGVPADEGKAIALFKKAAGLGSKEARRA